MVIYILETETMTYTGINDGYIGNTGFHTIPLPWNLTDIKDINAEKTNINITPNADGCDFIIRCPTGIYAQSYAVYDLSGRTLQTGRFSGTSGLESIPVAGLRSGVYFVQVRVVENGGERVVTKKVVKK